MFDRILSVLLVSGKSLTQVGFNNPKIEDCLSFAIHAILKD